MRVCRECGIFIQTDKKATGRPPELCSDCKIKLRRELQKQYWIKYKNLKKLGIQLKNKEIGNPAQDKQILKFLDKKRKKEDMKYTR